MPEKITNIEYKSLFDSEDLKVAGSTVSSNTTDLNFGSSPEKQVIEMHVYTEQDEYVDSVYDLQPITRNINAFDVDDGELVFFTDISANLKNMGLGSGNYKIRFNFVLPLYDDSGVWYVKDISTSRTEARIIPNSNFNLDESDVTFQQKLKEIEEEYPDSQLILNFGENQLSLTVNQLYSSGLVFKLYKPLLDSIQDSDEVVPQIQLANSIWLDVIYDEVGDEEQPIRILTNVNKNVDINRLYQSSQTAFRSWNDLLSTNTQTSEQLVDHYLSSSKWESTINVDYTEFDNFIFFSSAEERVKNFTYKMELLEQYSSSVASLTASSAAEAGQVTASINYFNRLQRGVVNGFDGYEQWLYTTSGSTYSSSLGHGEVTESTWPKVAGASTPYDLSDQEKTTSVNGLTWYNNEILRAREYDNQNYYKLIDTIPSHIREDEDNAPYELFVNMVGQHFDDVWLHISKLNQRYDFKHKLTEGTAKDVIWSTLKSFGLDLSDGNDAMSLWRYAFGYDSSGNFQNNTYKMSYEDATKEVWKRLLNNLPYLLKTKGTERGIRALITCYGIPSTILKIREFGGPDPDLNFETTNYIRDVFSYALNLDSLSKVSGSWNDFGGSTRPDSIEFRFNTDVSQTALLFETNDKTDAYLRLVVSSSASLYENVGGTVSFTVQDAGATNTQTVTTPEIPIFNDTYWNVLLTRDPADADTGTDHTFTLYVKNSEFDKITHQVTASLTLDSAVAASQSLIGAWESGSEFNIAGGSVDGAIAFYSGTFQEFRMWRNTLNESVFNSHVLAPTSYNGNTYSSSYSDLLLRYRFNQSEFYSSGSYVSLMLDSNPSQGNIYNGFWSGSSSASVFASQDERNVFSSPNIGLRRWVSNKVRVDNYISSSKNLDRTKRTTISRYDNAPLDSNKVGVYLSPQDLVNDDIISTYADFNFDNFIGSPVEWYGNEYSELKTAREVYFSKYSESQNIFTYLGVINYFNKSLFEQVKKMLPARVDANVGVLIEQHFLERPKVSIKKLPTATNDALETEINYATIYSASSDTVLLDGLIDATVFQPDPNGDIFTYMNQTPLNAWPSGSSKYSIPTLRLSSSVSNSVLTITETTYTWSPTESQVFPVSDFWLDEMSYTPVTASTGNVIGYSGSHYIHHRDTSTPIENLLYKGCKQTIYTTPDKGLPFESVEDTQNRLVVVDESKDKSRLKVE